MDELERCSNAIKVIDRCSLNIDTRPSLYINGAWLAVKLKHFVAHRVCCTTYSDECSRGGGTPKINISSHSSVPIPYCQIF